MSIYSSEKQPFMMGMIIVALSTLWNIHQVSGFMSTTSYRWIGKAYGHPIVPTDAQPTQPVVGNRNPTHNPITQYPPSRSSHNPLHESNHPNNNYNDKSNEEDETPRNFPHQDQSLLNHRLSKLRAAIYDTEVSRPPNPSYSASEFIIQLLDALKDPDDPLPHSGYRVLLRSSTEQWRSKMAASIGIPISPSSSSSSGPTESKQKPIQNSSTLSKTRPSTKVPSEDIFASALGSSLARPQNQFGILVSTDDSEPYTLHIGEILDYYDGTCWVDCNLRSLPDEAGRNGGKLLVKLGWSLIRREADGAWMLDQLDWQDFREEFRPGIGREEWVRICG